MYRPASIRRDMTYTSEPEWHLPPWTDDEVAKPVTKALEALSAELARFKTGELYDSRKVDDLRKALVATGLFASVAVDPVQTGEPGPDGTEYVDLHVDQEAGPARRLRVALTPLHGVGGEIRVADVGADAQRAIIVDLDVLQREQVADVDQQAGFGDTELHMVDEVGATGQEGGIRVLGDGADGVLDAGGPVVLEGDHRAPWWIAATMFG